MNSDFKELLSLFNANNVEYLIVGGVAYIFYAEPRYTKDLDVWIKADRNNATNIYHVRTQCQEIVEAGIDGSVDLFPLPISPLDRQSKQSLSI